MKIHTGLVGPRDTVNLIEEILIEYDDNIVLVPFVYTRAEETTEIVEKNKHLVDMWLFSGVTPFTLAKNSSSQQLFFYLELNGNSLTNVLVNMKYKDKLDIRKISFDMLKKRDIYETYNDLEFELQDIHLYEYPGHTPLQEIIDFHRNLFEAGKVNVCVTCLRNVYEELEAQNIPVYRITPTKSNIRSTVETALQQWETFQFKQSQIAVMLIRTGNMENVEDKHTVSYDSHRLNLNLQSAIVDYAEAVTGSFVSLGIGKFIVFSTRGAIEQYEPKGLSLLEQLALVTDLPSHIGIGYGDTSVAAEDNARLALQHAQSYGDLCAFLVDNKGVIEGPLGEKQYISFEYRTENKEINSKLEKAGITITTFNKLLSVQKKRVDNSLTATDLAEWLKMTDRNARRILKSLEKQGIVDIIGKEAPKTGRPRQIYRLNIKGE